jgi:glutaminase
VRGIAACRALSRDFSLHAFADRTNVRGVIRREYRASEVRSKRLRSAEEQGLLRAAGGRVVVIEAQGALFFGSTEVLIRRMGALGSEAQCLIVDFRRASFADPSAIGLIEQTARGFGIPGCRLIVTGLDPDGPLGRLHTALANGAPAESIEFLPDIDRALETCEDRILAERGRGDATKYALGQLELFAGLSPSELRLLEAEVGSFHFDAGARIIRKGDPANAFFVIARGTAVISIEMDGGRRKRLGSIGPGYSIGEMALVEEGQRSADVHAEGPVTCYSMSMDRLRLLGEAHPNIMITILRNLVGILSGRLRMANDEIGNLE